MYVCIYIYTHYILSYTYYTWTSGLEGEVERSHIAAIHIHRARRMARAPVFRAVAGDMFVLGSLK